jgi:hypothetical protein
VSTTALALGTTMQRKLSGSSAVQSTVLAGVGYGAAGAIRSADESDYHFGMTPQMLATVRFIPGDRAAFDVTVRDYYVSRIASTKHQGSEPIARADALFSVRIAAQHAASVGYTWTRRAASGTDPGLADIIQSRGSVGFFYTYLGGTHFGAVEF